MARNRKISRYNKEKAIQETVERSAKSQQPRFENKNYRQIAEAIYKFMLNAEDALPPYKSDTRNRDKELMRLVRSENIISGILSSVVARDQNRAWLLTGGVRQVSQYGSKLHHVHDGSGWRKFVSLNSTSYHVTDFGFMSEVGFASRNGRAETMWNIDPTRTKFSGIIDTPVTYFPPNASKVNLEPEYYINGNSMPAIEESLRGIGFSAVERCLYAIRMMMGIFRHSLEKLGFSPPKGILLGKGIRRQDLDAAYQRLKEDKERQDVAFYEGVLALFTSNPQAKIDLVSLSELPDNFSLGQWLDNLVKIMSLAFNYPIAEFWSLDTGTWGRGETDALQFEQATSKGENSFALSFQEQLQRKYFPETVDFVFDNRNEAGELVVAERKSQAADMIGDLYEKGLQYGESLISKEEARKLLVQNGIIPQEFTDEEEPETSATDLKAIREMLLSDNKIFRIAQEFPNEPIVQYRWQPDIIGKINMHSNVNEMITREICKVPYHPGSYVVLWESGSDVFRKRVF